MIALRPLRYMRTAASQRGGPTSCTVITETSAVLRWDEKARVFVGSSSEGRATAVKVAEALGGGGDARAVVVRFLQDRGPAAARVGPMLGGRPTALSW